MTTLRPIEKDELVAWLYTLGVSDNAEYHQGPTAEYLAEKLLDRFDISTYSKDWVGLQ